MASTVTVTDMVTPTSNSPLPSMNVTSKATSNVSSENPGNLPRWTIATSVMIAIVGAIVLYVFLRHGSRDWFTVGHRSPESRGDNIELGEVPRREDHEAGVEGNDRVDQGNVAAEGSQPDVQEVAAVGPNHPDEDLVAGPSSHN